jgi:poly-beta-1,6-N-acetyl-D-glucosamine N-deacetylase
MPKFLFIPFVVIWIFFINELKSIHNALRSHTAKTSLTQSRNITGIIHSKYLMNTTNDIKIEKKTVDEISFVFASGGKVVTTYSSQPSQVVEISVKNNLVAGVDGTFFHMEDSTSSQIIGPILSSKNVINFIPGREQDLTRIQGRPLVLIGSNNVKFLPFNPKLHNTFSGFKSELTDVKDAFVSGAWLVKKGKAQPLASFGNLYKVNEPRYRAFWGLNSKLEPTIGITTVNVGAVDLGLLLEKEQWKEVVMLDSGQSTSLVYKGKSLVGYTPRPVPHAVGLVK